MRRLIPTAVALATVLTGGSAQAAERRWPIGSVERLRVEAPVEVRVTTGGSTGVVATAIDKAALDMLEVTATGGTLVIRTTRRAGAAAAAATPGAIVVTVATPRLDALAVYAAATVSVSAMRGGRIALSNAGGGSLSVQGIDAADVAATLAGEGTMTLAGRTGAARLVANGPAVLDARTLVADRIDVQAAGDAVVRAAARYEADVIASQAAQVEVAGRPRCTVRAPKGTTVRCGTR